MVKLLAERDTMDPNSYKLHDVQLSGGPKDSAEGGPRPMQPTIIGNPQGVRTTDPSSDP